MKPPMTMFNKFFASLIVALAIVLMAFQASAAIHHLGVFGRTYPITEKDAIQELKQEGLRPAVLGAGLLDAQAMSCGEAGISSAASSPLEPLYADIALRAPDFASALNALFLLRRAKTALRRNLLLSVFFSAILILPGSGLLAWPDKQDTVSALYLCATLFAVAALAANSYLLRRVKLS